MFGRPVKVLLLKLKGDILTPVKKNKYNNSLNNKFRINLGAWFNHIDSTFGA